MCFFGISMKCTGATGWMSWNASIVVVLVDLPARNLAAHDLAENAVGIRCHVSVASPAGRRPAASRLHASAAGPVPHCIAIPARREAGRAGQRPAARPSRRGPDVPSRRASSASTSARPQAVAGQQDEAVEPEVGDFGRDARRITVLGGHDRLGRLLADLLEDRVVALGEQRRDVRPAGSAPRRASIVAAIAREHVVVAGFSHGHRSPSGPSAPARRRATHRPRACWKKQRSRPVWQAMPPTCSTTQQDRVVVAVEADFAHTLHVAGLFALAPQLARASATSSAPRRVAAVRASASRFIHASVSTCAVAGVLRDRGHEAVVVPADVVEPAPVDRGAVRATQHDAAPRRLGLSLCRTSMPARHRGLGLRRP